MMLFGSVCNASVFWICDSRLQWSTSWFGGWVIATHGWVAIVLWICDYYCGGGHCRSSVDEWCKTNTSRVLQSKSNRRICDYSREERSLSGHLWIRLLVYELRNCLSSMALKSGIRLTKSSLNQPFIHWLSVFWQTISSSFEFRLCFNTNEMVTELALDLVFPFPKFQPFRRFHQIL